MGLQVNGAKNALAAEPEASRGYPFLSREWVHEATHVVQAARTSNKEFGKLIEGFTVNLLYLITDFHPNLAAFYGSSQLAIFVKIDKGKVRKLLVGGEPPREKIDFTVASDYSVAKRLFLGELNPATSFVNRQIKVEPLSRVYQRPRFTAKSIVAGNAILRIVRKVPTVFLPEDAVFPS